ncbi:RiPP maturation radical SAM protein 1, partial [Streptomyces sp. NPDC006510]
MPWNSAIRPSIQVGILRSVAEAEGWQVDASYAYLNFYGLAQQALGFSDAEWSDAYELVSEKLYHMAVGDWIYACRHADSERRAAYFEELRGKRVDEETIALIDSLREVADRHVEETTESLLRSAPEVIGFTSMFSQNGPTLAVAGRLRERGYTGMIVLGGSNCEGPMGRALLANYPAVDAVVDGPGEDAFVALLRQVENGEPATSQGRLVTRHEPDTAPSTARAPEDSLRVPTPNYDGFFEQLQTAGLHHLEAD